MIRFATGGWWGAAIIRRGSTSCVPCTAAFVQRTGKLRRAANGPPGPRDVREQCSGVSRGRRGWGICGTTFRSDDGKPAASTLSGKPLTCVCAARTVNLQEKRLFASATDRQKYDGLADLYTLILQTEHLERMFARGNVSREDVRARAPLRRATVCMFRPHAWVSSQYEKQCTLLITRFKMTSRSLMEEGHITTAADFIKEYGLESRCTQAKTRLLKVGMPATMVTMQADGRDSAVAVRDCTQYFITAMDNLRLKLIDVDEVQPFLSDVVHSCVALPAPPCCSVSCA